MAIKHDQEHFCPIYDRVIDPDLCYDSVMCLLGFFKIESTQELLEIGDIEDARLKCRKCPYSDMT